MVFLNVPVIVSLLVACSLDYAVAEESKCITPTHYKEIGCTPIKTANESCPSSYKVTTATTSKILPTTSAISVASNWTIINPRRPSLRVSHTPSAQMAISSLATSTVDIRSGMLRRCVRT